MGLRLEVEVDGEKREVDVDLSLSSLTLREGLRLQDAIGISTFDKMMDGKRVPRDLHIIEALIWCKLATHYPELAITDFDLPMEALSGLGKSEDENVVKMPMTTPDGETVEAEAEVAAGNG